MRGKTVRLAQILDIKVIVTFSGCPGGTPTDAQPNWITYRWPPEYAAALDWQWKEKVIPYWKQAAKFAREHGVHLRDMFIAPWVACIHDVQQQCRFASLGES